MKQRKDSLEIFQKQARPDLAKKEEEEILVIEKFLPAQLSQSELIEEVKKVIAATGASSPGDMGKVMGIASKQLAGKADGKSNFNYCKGVTKVKLSLNAGRWLLTLFFCF